MTRLEADHSEKAEILESLQTDLVGVQSEQNKVDLELGGRRDSLAAQERELRVGG